MAGICGQQIVDHELGPQEVVGGDHQGVHGTPERGCRAEKGECRDGLESGQSGKVDGAGVREGSKKEEEKRARMRERS